MQTKWLNLVLNSIVGLGIFVLVALPLAFILPGVPEIWYRLDASAVEKEQEYLLQDLGQTEQDFVEAGDDLVIKDRPPVDPSLPRENRIKIRSIGVDGMILEGKNPEYALSKGIWRTNNLGTPDDTLPTVLASHRYGNPNWSTAFRDEEIFYNLDKVSVGDKIEVIWQQRLYRYEVKATDVNVSIEQKYTGSDLIVYTCNYWNSPQRIFVYGERI